MRKTVFLSFLAFFISTDAFAIPCRVDINGVMTPPNCERPTPQPPTQPPTNTCPTCNEAPVEISLFDFLAQKSPLALKLAPVVQALQAEATAYTSAAKSVAPSTTTTTKSLVAQPMPTSCATVSETMNCASALNMSDPISFLEPQAYYALRPTCQVAPSTASSTATSKFSAGGGGSTGDTGNACFGCIYSDLGNGSGTTQTLRECNKGCAAAKAANPKTVCFIYPAPIPPAESNPPDTVSPVDLVDIMQDAKCNDSSIWETRHGKGCAHLFETIKIIVKCNIITVIVSNACSEFPINQDCIKLLEKLLQELAKLQCNGIVNLQIKAAQCAHPGYGGANPNIGRPVEININGCNTCIKLPPCDTGACSVGHGTSTAYCNKGGTVQCQKCVCVNNDPKKCNWEDKPDTEQTCGNNIPPTANPLCVIPGDISKPCNSTVAAKCNCDADSKNEPLRACKDRNGEIIRSFPMFLREKFPPYPIVKTENYPGLCCEDAKKAFSESNACKNACEALFKNSDIANCFDINTVTGQMEPPECISR